MRNAYGNITAPPNGYIWDARTRAGVSRPQLRRVRASRTTSRRQAARPASTDPVPGLVGPRAPDLSALRSRRSRTTSASTSGSRSSGSSRRTATCRASSILRLGNDHTAGTRPGFPTPRAMIAENDLALGRLVEAIIAEPLLEGVGDLRPRGRRAERPRPRRRAPLGRARGRARTRGAARWTARSTRRRACCARWS